MRVMKRNPWLTGLGTVLSLVGLWWGSAQGGVASTDQTASLIVFPKVIADGTRDTLIQLVNASQFNEYRVHCVYINATGRCGSASAAQVCTSDLDCPDGLACVGIGWDESDFTIQLTRQQPTIWRVSTGRNPNIGQTTMPGQCTPAQPALGTRQDCPGAFGNEDVDVPGTNAGFRGELRCYEVMSDGTPVGTNALKGEAILEPDPDAGVCSVSGNACTGNITGCDTTNANDVCGNIGAPQISEYNAIGFRGLNVPENATALNLDNHDYDVCPAELQMTNYPVGADDVVARGFGATSCPATGDCPVDTQLTLIPCSVDYTAFGGPSVVTTQFRFINEFEQNLSLGGISTSIPDLTCFFNGSLDQIGSGVFHFGGPSFGSLYKTRIFPQGGGRCQNSHAQCDLGSGATECGTGDICRPASGLLAVAEEFHKSAAIQVRGAAAFNLHAVGNRGVCTNSGNACTGVNTGCNAADPADLCENDAVVVGNP